MRSSRLSYASRSNELAGDDADAIMGSSDLLIDLIVRELVCTWISQPIEKNPDQAKSGDLFLQRDNETQADFNRMAERRKKSEADVGVNPAPQKKLKDNRTYQDVFV